MPRGGEGRAATARRRARGDDGGWFKYAMLLPAIVWVIAFTFFPLISVLHFSFTNYVLGQGITGYVGLQNYINVLESAEFWHSIAITAIYVAVAVPIEVVLGFLLAWLVSLGASGSRVFRGILAAPLFTMGVAVGYLGVTLYTDQGGPITLVLGLLGIHIPWFSTGWGGLLGAIILDIWRWTPFVFLIALAAIGAIPATIYEAALLDTRSHWQIMWRLALPLCWPVMTVAILLRLIEALKVFGLPFALTSGGPGTSTQVFSIADYLTTIQFFDFGKGSAMGIIFLILVSIIITFFFRQMRRNIE
ncbi:MAG TPA: sugar ABC transporter permease [Acetobacteraceae bacterium]|nr:sugar ABC transporter permease [Acetobacteraceae bacterium]